MIDPNEYSELIVMIFTVIGCWMYSKRKKKFEIYEVERIVEIRK